MSTIQSLIKPSEKTAIIIPDPNLTVTYNQLNGIVYHLQSIFSNSNSPLFNHGSKRQLKIATSLPNGLEFLAAFLAITTTGNLISPLNPSSTQTEVVNYLTDLEADAIIVPRYTHLKPESPLVLAAKEAGNTLIVEIWYDSARKILQFELFSAEILTSVYNSVTDKPSVPPNDAKGSFVGSAVKNDIALVLFTSGTTGKPKRVPLTHENLTASINNIIKSYRLRSRDRTYVVMPLFHIHGLQMLLSSLASDGSAVIPQRFSASKFYPHFKTYGFDWYSAVPTIHLILLNRQIPDDVKGKLRFIRSCSSSLNPTTFTQLENKFGCPVVEAYGMTEAAHQVTSNNLPFHGKIKRMAGTVGIPQGAIDLLIADDDNSPVKKGGIGQVCISGSNVTAGYIDNEEANKDSFFIHDGKRFFKTGDLGQLDDEGRLSLKGRIKEIINRGGEKISPIEIDAALSALDKVRECVTFGAPDPKYGQVVHCAVVLKDNTQANDEEFKSFLSKKLATFKIPEKFYIVQELPKTATGKVQRRIMAGVFSSKSKI